MLWGDAYRLSVAREWPELGLKAQGMARTLCMHKHALLCVCGHVDVCCMVRGAFRGAARVLAAAAFNAAQSERPPPALRLPRLLAFGQQSAAWLAWDRAVGTVTLANTRFDILLLPLYFSRSRLHTIGITSAPSPPLSAPVVSQVARDQLLGTCRELQRRGAPATPSLLRTLHLLHSYLLVRTLVRQGDHPAAARLLLVVADGIAAFPRHAAAILTSAVIECHRAGLHSAAQRWAAALQQPPYAGQVAAAYAKKIEAIARQPAWTECGPSDAEPACDCLFCGAPGPESALRCASCSRELPFCCASGKRMALGDWSECPSCHFPCRGRDMTRVASQEHACPLCEAALGPHDIKRIFDPISALRRTVFSGLLRGSSRERDGC
ncbi:hypothetical protein ABPG77_009663 [Micractinium sp. CCAP 211/92]